MDFTTVVKAPPFGGGGFVYDTSSMVLIRLRSGSLTGSLIQANGGNDSIKLAAQIYNSTVYGGQGADTVGQTGSNESIRFLHRW